MVSLKKLLTFGLIGSAAAVPNYPTRPHGCGEVDIFFTGLPPYHPLVRAQGFDPAMVDRALRADAASVIKAGYNLKGPEQSIDVLAKQMRGRDWDGTGVGYGVRGSRLENLTVRFEDTLQLYRDRAPRSTFLFNFSPNTTLWAAQRRFPLSSDCAGSPGKDLGFNVICDICEQ